MTGRMKGEADTINGIGFAVRQGLDACIAAQAGARHLFAGGGGLNLIGDLYKTEVFGLARWYNEYAGTEHDPLFVRINRALSALWAVLFLWLAAANALHLPAWASLGPVAVGITVSVLAPRRWVKAALQARLLPKATRKTPAQFRTEIRKAVADLDLPGYAIGGLSVGEPLEYFVPALAAAIGLDALVEVHDQIELDRALALDAEFRVREVVRTGQLADLQLQRGVAVQRTGPLEHA